MILTQIRCDLQIVHYCKVGKDSASLWNMYDAQLDDFMRGHLSNVLPLENYASARSSLQASDRTQSRCFSCTVRANQRNDFTVVHIEGNPFYGLNCTIVNMQIPNLKFQSSCPLPNRLQ